MKVLSFISREKENILPGEIASSLNMTGGRVAGILRSLEKKELIVRDTDKTDRRRVLVNITEKGKEKVHKGTVQLMDRLSQVTEIMGDENTDGLIKYIGELLETIGKASEERGL